MSNVRKRNRRLAKKLAEQFVATRDPFNAEFLAATVKAGMVPRKPWKSRAKGTMWTAYRTHSQTTPEVPIDLFVTWTERLTAERKPP